MLLIIKPEAIPLIWVSTEGINQNTDFDLSNCPNAWIFIIIKNAKRSYFIYYIFCTALFFS